MRPFENTLIAEETSLQERVERVNADRIALRPLSTYRLQFNQDFRFADAQRLIPYLKALGISHVYASPLLRARAGSTHGYDIGDHNQLNPELGDEVSFERLAQALKEHGMGLILDTVPNHMGIGTGDNPWWQDVLCHGQASEFADFFDIDWTPLKVELRNKVLLPILGNQYGEELESGRIRIKFEGGEFFLQYYETRLPIDPQSLPLVLSSRGNDSEFERLLSKLRDLPAHYELDGERVRQRQAAIPALLQRLRDRTTSDEGVRYLVEERVKLLNGTPGVPASFDELHALLEAQPYRLAHWRVSSEEINYRRFFDVNHLVGLRMENPRVFAETHKLIRRLMATGAITGVRVDHCDGLLNPRQYLIRLQMLYYASQLCGAEPQGEVTDNGIELEVLQSLGTQERLTPAFYCVVEKILEPGESLPTEWPVDGTSGYDFIPQVNGLFLQKNSETALTRLYHRLLGESISFDSLLYHSKKVIMHTALSSEINVLAHLLDEISSTDRHARDFTRKTLRDAIRETIACFPVYRSYVDERGEIFERDRARIQTAIAKAKARNTGTSASVFDFLGSTLLTDKPADPDAEYRRRLHFILKFQQLTGPVMAKGLEDTAFYVYNRFVSNNEVGSLPKSFSTSVEEFHRTNQQRFAEWPNAMLTTSTHDTKRSEDVRARLNVLSEMPLEWGAKVNSWRRLNARFKTVLPDGRSIPDANEEYLLYQTLVGTWPFAMRREEERAEFTRRIQAYMEKAIHEAKVNVSWINPDPQYSEGMRSFVAQILSPGSRGRSNFFLKRIEAFLPAVQFFGAMNSLAQTLLKMTSPGVPDVYQGTELFDFSLVDPDNRRPVDFEVRDRLLVELNRGGTGPQEMLQHYTDGRIKLYITMRALRLRGEYPRIFREGTYTPLEATGEKADHVCAFARGALSQRVITIVPRLAYTLMKGAAQPPLGEVWGKTAVVLPEGCPATFHNVLTGQTLSGEDGMLLCRDLFAELPVALLVQDSLNEENGQRG